MINSSYLANQRFEAEQKGRAKVKAKLQWAINECDTQAQRDKVMELYLQGEQMWPCDNYVEDPCICDDIGEPKGQCVCGYSVSEHVDLLLFLNSQVA